jgi:hypothetical protein
MSETKLKRRSSTHIPLNDDQQDMLEPMFAKARKAAHAGRPGVMIAHVFGDHIRATFIEHEVAKEIQRVLDVPPGMTVQEFEKNQQS